MLSSIPRSEQPPTAHLSTATFAMAPLHGAVVAKSLALQDIYARRASENQEPCTTESLNHWFRACSEDNAAGATPERARKRRKLDRGGAARRSVGVLDIDLSRTVLLASVELDLVRI